MNIINKKEPVFLFLGDILCLVFSLWLTLFARNGVVPLYGEFLNHLVPFSFIFIIWLCVFFISGLYEKHTRAFRRKLPSLILRTQGFNAVIAVVFFYLASSLGVSPKTILFIYLVLSSVTILLWRLYGERVFGIHSREKAILIATGREMQELSDEIKNNSRYEIDFVSVIDTGISDSGELEKKLEEAVADHNISTVVLDLYDDKVEPLLPVLYGLVLRRVAFVDMHVLYENIFDRIPLSLLEHRWFLKNMSIKRLGAYEAFRRFMDFAVSGVLGIISLILYPFIALAIFAEDRGSVFIVQDRVGRNNRIIRVRKFRSMTFSDDGVSVEDKRYKITAVGSFLRKTRLDELPQLWSVVKGDLSLIGPRPELPRLALLYEAQVPYYNVRHTVTPGLSGWAQIYHEQAPKFGIEVDATREKLSYDLYYIKNRSVLLDFKIALKTLKTLLSRSGV